MLQRLVETHEDSQGKVDVLAFFRDLAQKGVSSSDLERWESFLGDKDDRGRVASQLLLKKLENDAVLESSVVSALVSSVRKKLQLAFLDRGWDCVAAFGNLDERKKGTIDGSDLERFSKSTRGVLTSAEALFFLERAGATSRGEIGLDQFLVLLGSGGGAQTVLPRRLGMGLEIDLGDTGDRITSSFACPLCLRRREFDLATLDPHLREHHSMPENFSTKFYTRYVVGETSLFEGAADEPNEQLIGQNGQIYITEGYLSRKIVLIVKSTVMGTIVAMRDISQMCYAEKQIFSLKVGTGGNCISRKGTIPHISEFPLFFELNPSRTATICPTDILAKSGDSCYFRKVDKGNGRISRAIDVYGKFIQSVQAPGPSTMSPFQAFSPMSPMDAFWQTDLSPTPSSTATSHLLSPTGSSETRSPTTGVPSNEPSKPSNFAEK